MILGLSKIWIGLIVHQTLHLLACLSGHSNNGNHYDIFADSSSKMEQMVNYTAQINKPLVLRFRNMSISNGSCDDFYDRATKLEATISNSTLYVSNVTYGMSTRWKCKLVKNNMTNSPKRYYYLYLNLHVKGAKSVEVTVNDKKMSFKEANMSVPYDGDADYLYEDGERGHIVCRNPQKKGKVHLHYYMKGAGNITNTTTPALQLHLRSNHSYVDCVYTSTDPKDTYVYRVNFVPKKLVHSNESKTLTSLLVSSIGAVLVVLVVIGTVCYCVRTRAGKNIETPYGDLTNSIDNSNSQNNKCDNQYDECHYNDRLSKRETYYETPASTENMDLDVPNYTEIDYSLCKTKIAETPRRNSYIYDEPYL